MKRRAGRVSRRTEQASQASDLKPLMKPNTPPISRPGFCMKKLFLRERFHHLCLRLERIVSLPCMVNSNREIHGLSSTFRSIEGRHSEVNLSSLHQPYLT